MIERRTALIVYDGKPVSSGGAHRLGRQGPSQVWRQLSRFLDTCTHPIGPREAMVLVYESVGGALASVQAAKTSAIARFGPPHSRIAVTGASRIREHAWLFDPDRVPDALEWLAGQSSVPSIATGAGCVVSVQARFRLKDPDSGEVLPFQSAELYGQQELRHGLRLGDSIMYARLGVKSTCLLTLCLPYVDVSSELLRLVGALQGHLPFKLSVKHWSRWQLNSTGRSYYARKVSVAGVAPGSR
jgi:hypothetical protein